MTLAWSWPYAGLLAELAEARGSEQQLAQYVAVRAGVRRCLDDWVPASRFEAYRAALVGLGFAIDVDCLFHPIDESVDVPGADVVPTTRAFGSPIGPGSPGAPGGSPGAGARASVHVFVSSRADWAAEAHRSGWYSVAVGDRLVRKPLVDHLRFGRALGYPDCCVRFFLQHNDWPRRSTFADALAASTRRRWQTNCLPRHTPWMATFHMPCGFDCAPTVEHATRVLDAVRAIDPGYAAQIERFMRHPVLVVNEVHCYALVGGGVQAGRCRYEQAVYLGGDRRNDRYAGDLAGGDAVEVGEGSIFVLRRGQLERTIETRCDRGRIDVPMILAFE